MSLADDGECVFDVLLLFDSQQDATFVLCVEEKLPLGGITRQPMWVFDLRVVQRKEQAQSLLAGQELEKESGGVVANGLGFGQLEDDGIDLVDSRPERLEEVTGGRTHRDLGDVATFRQFAKFSLLCLFNRCGIDI